MARVLLKDGRTGELLHIHEGIATVNVDTTSNNPGGTVQVHETEIKETASGAELTGDVPFIPPVAAPVKPVEDGGVLALAGSAELLRPVFVAALSEALGDPAVIAKIKTALKDLLLDPRFMAEQIEACKHVAENTLPVLAGLEKMLASSIQMLDKMEGIKKTGAGKPDSLSVKPPKKKAAKKKAPRERLQKPGVKKQQP